MRLEPDDMIPGPDPQGPVAWWLLLAIAGVAVCAASLSMAQKAGVL